MENITNQCFWISILDFLQDNGRPELTLLQLRTEECTKSICRYTVYENQ